MSHYTLITADIHLQTDETHSINQAFRHFLKTQAMQADALYLLGDTFEAWVGDDIGCAIYSETLTLLKQLTQNGLPIYLQFGNRDFLMKSAFWQATGMHYLAEPCETHLYQQTVVLLHGDALCTDDQAYQKMRKWFRHPFIQWIFLKLPKAKRQAIGDSMREKSKRFSQNKSENIMDVNAQAVNELMRHYPNAQHLIHGHTHRPQKHLFSLNKRSLTRWVLGDWRAEPNQVSAQYLKISAEQGIQMQSYLFTD